MSSQLAFRRVLLKLSGEAFGRGGIDVRALAFIVREVVSLRRTGAKLAIVVGGGNIWRKREQGRGMDEVTADYLGMLATVMNGLALASALNAAGVRACVQSYLACEVPGIEPMSARRARAKLAQGTVVVFVSGTGKPFVTTDTAAAQRASDILADAIIKVGPADGVYTADPTKSKRAKKFATITAREALKRRLGFMDASALKLCAKRKLSIIVCRWQAGVLARVVAGRRVGTLVTP